MVDIYPQNVTWPSPSQYIQSAINAQPSGSTFVLKAGVHRMQTVALRTNDILTFEPGAIMRGSESFKGWTWTKDGTNNRWYTSISSVGSLLNSTSMRDTYLTYQNHIILDGEPMAYRNSISYVDAWTAYFDSSAQRLYIGINPANLVTIEFGRTALALQAATGATGCLVQGSNGVDGIIENYASSTQSENAAVKVGRAGSSTVPNANWTFQDMIVRNCRGMSLAHGSNCTIRRNTIYNAGQLGVGGSSTSDTLWENNAVFRCGIGGWRSGFEAGNSKFARTIRHINRGNWYDSLAPWEDISDVHPHIEFTGPLWYDIDNDGAEIYGNHILDRAHKGGRGLFWEISFSAKMYSNTLFELAWDTENGFWSDGIIFSVAGAVPGVTIFPYSLVYDNILYMCSGGVKNEQDDHSFSYSSLYNRYYFSQYCTIYRNAISMKHGFVDSNGVPFNGIHGSDGKSTTGVWGDGITSEDNLFVVNSVTSSHWREDPDEVGGGIGQVPWATWIAAGFDSPNGQAFNVDMNNPKLDFNPYRGGAM